MWPTRIDAPWTRRMKREAELGGGGQTDQARRPQIPDQLHRSACCYAAASTGNINPLRVLRKRSPRLVA